MFVGRSTTTLAALLCCTFLIVIDIEHVTSMSLDRLAIDRNEIESEKQPEQEDYSANSNVIVNDMEVEAMPAAEAGVAGDTDLYVLLPADSVSQAESIDQNTIEENMPIAASADEDSSSNLVESGGDMLMMETNDTPAAMQAVLMPVEVADAGASEMESEAEVEAQKIDEQMLPVQEVVMDDTTPAVSSMSNKMVFAQEAMLKDEEQLPAALTDKVEEIAVDTEMASANKQEASSNQETIASSEAQVEQAVEAASEVEVEKSDAVSETVADIIADALELVEEKIDAEPTIVEELKTEADNNAEVNNDNKDEVPLVEIVENENIGEMPTEGLAEKQDAEVDSATESVMETKSDIIDSLTAAMDAMLPAQSVESELQTEEQASHETVQDGKLEELAEFSEAEISPEEALAEAVKEASMAAEANNVEEQTEAAETENLQTADANEMKTVEQANPETDVEQMIKDESVIEEAVVPQEDFHMFADKQEEHEIIEEKQDEIVQNQVVGKDTIPSEVSSEEVSKVETDNTEKLEEVSNTQDQEQEIETVNQAMETQNTPNEDAVAAENNQSETIAVIQDQTQLVEQPQEIQLTETQEETQQESEVQPEIISSNDEVQPEIIASNDEVQPEIIASNDEGQPEIIASNEDEIKQDELMMSENIEETPMKVEELVNIESEKETETEVKPEPVTEVNSEQITEDKQDDDLMAETAQTAADSQEQQQIEVITENILSTGVSANEPQTETAIDSASNTEAEQQITLMDDTVAPALVEPTQEITNEETQTTQEEALSADTNDDKQPIILMDEIAAPEINISAQEQNAEETQKPEELASTSILTTIVQVPQELQMQTEEAAVEEAAPTKVENDAAVVVPAPQESTAPLAAVVVESTTQKPLIVADSVLNYVNASLMHINNNNKPLHNEELFNAKLRRYDGAQVWRIVVQNDKDKKLAEELQTKYDGQLWKEVTQEVDYLLKPQNLAAAEKHIRAANLSRIVLIDNLQKVIEVENPPADEIALLQNRKGHRLTWQAYHRLDDIHGFFDYLAKTYPDICAVETIGYSVQKRPLKILKISNGNTGNPGIWIDGGMHAREWISPASVTYIANQIVEGWDDLPASMKNVNWYIHAVANPDGYEYSHTTDRLWRKNMRAHGRQCPGVDLNRNFGYKWGGRGTSANPCSQTYRGSKAFSEPETFYISKYISNFPRETFQAYLSFHSYGQYILYPWGYDYHLTKDRSDLDRVARQAGTIITKGSGVKYTVGSSATTLYPAAGGSDDWAKGIAGIKYAYTIELGDTGRYGFVLPASFIEYNGKDSFTFVETVARAVTQGDESRKRSL